MLFLTQIIDKQKETSNLKKKNAMLSFLKKEFDSVGNEPYEILGFKTEEEMDKEIEFLKQDKHNIPIIYV